MYNNQKPIINYDNSTTPGKNEHMNLIITIIIISQFSIASFGRNEGRRTVVYTIDTHFPTNITPLLLPFKRCTITPYSEGVNLHLFRCHSCDE